MGESERAQRYRIMDAMEDDRVARVGYAMRSAGYGMSEDRRRSIEAGFNHHLVKPVDHQHLLELLNGGKSDN